MKSEKQDINFKKCGKYILTEHRGQDGKIRCIKVSYQNGVYYGNEDAFYCNECAESKQQRRILVLRFSKLTRPELEVIIKNANFTEDEELVFRSLAKGLTQKEISIKYCISLRTVERKVYNIKAKINQIKAVTLDS